MLTTQQIICGIFSAQFLSQAAEKDSAVLSCGSYCGCGNIRSTVPTEKEETNRKRKEVNAWTNTPFTLHSQNHFVLVWTISVPSVNTHGTVLCGTVPPRRDGPDRSRAVPLTSVTLLFCINPFR